MTHLDTGTLGAKVQSWRKDNPRSLLKRMMEESPRASKEKILREFSDYVRSEAGVDYLDTIIEYWFSNNWHSLAEKPESLLARIAERKTKTESLKETIKKRAVQMVLLDLTMPNGKALRYCTGRDCAKAGGWFTRIAKKIGAAGVVGKVLSEADVKSLFAEG